MKQETGGLIMFLGLIVLLAGLSLGLAARKLNKEPEYATHFKETCTKLNGTTVYDGKNYVCLK